jgi:Icc-related predicted phosphoesterase
MIKTIAAISDTHNKHNLLTIPEVDVLIHSGDITDNGTEEEMNNFINWFIAQNVKHKIFIPGNHDKCLENSSTYFDQIDKLCKQNNIHILINQSVEIDGIKFYGTPYSFHNHYKWWAYGKHLRSMNEIWDKIPTDTQILVTHVPPYKIMDISWDDHLGDEILAEKIHYLPRLKAHIFGHVHHSSGHFVRNGINFVNASMETQGKINPIRIIRL